MSPNAKGALLALLCYGIFSTHDVIVKMLGSDYSPFQIVFFSVLFGFPLSNLMLIKDTTAGNLRPKHPWWTLARTVAAVITGVCAFYAFSVLPLAQTYAIIFATPLLITMLSIPILGEHVGIHRGGAVVVGLIGVIIVLRPGGTELGLGHLAALVAAATGSLSAIIVRKIGQDERDVVLLLYPMMANCILMALLMPFFYEPMPLLHLAGNAAMALMAFVAGALLIAAYKTGEAVIVAPMQYSQIIWATLYGALFFNEIPDLWTGVGATVIIASGLYIVLREGTTKVSENRPVLRTRGRIETATQPRIGVFMRMAKRRKIIAN